MNQRLKLKWVKALRSGKYQQTDGMLCREVDEGVFGYCCLGVLAEISGVRRDKLFYQGTLDEVGRTKLLGPYEQEGVNETAQEKLAEMNDAGKSFKRIATWIEKRL